jgi:uncharacterized membrane protein
MPSQPIGGLVSAIRDDLAAIASDTKTLAKAEFSRDAKKIGLGVGLIAAAGFIATLVILLLVLAVVWGLVALGLAPWAAYLVGAAFFAAIAAAAVLVARSSFKGVGAPKRTAAAVRDSFAALSGLTPEQAAAARAEGRPEEWSES